MKKLIVFCLIAVFAAQSCTGRVSDAKGVHTEERSFDSFDGIKVSKFLNAKVVKGDHYGVKVNVPQQYADYLTVEIDSENNLVIRISSDKKEPKRSDKFEAEITCPSFDRILVENLASVEVISEYTFENIKLVARSLASISFKEQAEVKNNCQIEANDLAKMTLNLVAENLLAKSTSMSVITVSGTVSALDVNASDMAKINCRKLNTKTAKVRARAMSEIDVQADERFELSASDMSRIRYTGAGEVAKTHAESMSTIRKK
ncbi:MAG: DUF2807 domain-containing protein [Tannerella sp.]|jgi:hypothetical protein|nr:DUF2807 domain-containing protein [Tannerella sp.]